ncbi:hypothetical protein CRYUN_Cryun12cG0176200 [Craigia yunnanensis]
MRKNNQSSPSPSSTPKLKETKGLPTSSFASAAGVSKAWNSTCTHILSRPKLSSAISLNPSPLVALQEVFAKVMSEPIRPHFDIASVGPGFDFEDVLRFKLGSKTSIVLSSVSGIIGRDALTHEFKEVKWTNGDIDDEVSTNTGIVLTVGFVPGLKVDAIPLFLFGQKEARQGSMIDNFVTDIKSYTSSVSGCTCTSPLAIIMIGDADVDQKPIIEKLGYCQINPSSILPPFIVIQKICVWFIVVSNILSISDFAMSMETIIVGDERGQFVYRSGNDARNVSSNIEHSPDAVALVFARDRNRAHGIGDIEFHFAMSNGVSAIGPRLKAASMENNMECNDLYIGVPHYHFVGSDKPRLMTTLSLHGVVGGDEEYLYVDGVGIGTGHGESFFGHLNVDSSPFLENFPGVPLAGIFCGGEIGRQYTSLTAHGGEEGSALCPLHVYSTVYLVMSYTPADH